MRATFYVEGEVVGLHRPRFDGRHRRTYPVKADKAAKARVREAFRAAFPGAGPTERPCSVLVETWRALPKSRPKRVEAEADVFKPDADNVVKLVLDALNGVAWRDDGQVFECHVVKHPRERRDEDLMRVTIEVM